MHKIVRSEDSLNHLDQVKYVLKDFWDVQQLVKHHIFRFEEKSLFYEAVADTESAHFLPL